MNGRAELDIEIMYLTVQDPLFSTGLVASGGNIGQIPANLCPTIIGLPNDSKRHEQTLKMTIISKMARTRLVYSR